MAQPDIYGQLRSLFSEQPKPGASRRIVFWHDADESFTEAFAALDPEQIKGARPLRLADASCGSMFDLKRDLYRGHPDDDFLVYTKTRKDFSPHALEGNWLADLELACDHFQADFASMLAAEVGAVDEAVEAVAMFRPFFNAQDRKARFTKLAPHSSTRLEVVLGVLGTLLKSTTLSTEELVRRYLVALYNDEAPLEPLTKFGAAAAWCSFLDKRIGYCGNIEDASEIAAHILLSALAMQLPDGFLEGLEGRISLPHGQVCLNIVHAWMEDESMAEELYGLSRKVEAMCNLEKRFSSCDVQLLAEADVLPCIAERLVADYARSMAGGSYRADEVRPAVRMRRSMQWSGRLAPHYDALEAAADMQAFHRDNAEGFHLALPKEVWEAYTDSKSGWWRMDTVYRRFCKAVDSARFSDYDMPSHVEDSLEELATWMERIYVNWFLAETNSCWVRSAEKGWASNGSVEGVPRQTGFFMENVLAGANGARKTFVIISDALRYEVAAELAERLGADTKGNAELGSMLGVFPSITEFGMAALLPHHTLSYNATDCEVLLDDGAPTSSTAQRDAVLKRRVEKSLCIQSKDLTVAKRAERKTLVGDSELVYVYHNKIDATGEGCTTEHDVFEACDAAIKDIMSLVKLATAELGFTRVVITADHGFLYTRDPLEESAKVSGGDISGNTVKLGRRYAICDSWDEDPLFIKVNLERLGGGSFTGLAPRSCVRIKKAGPGENYVHGGVSLQEMCVPVIQFRNKRAGAKGYEETRPAGLSLLSTSRRVTSMMFRVELFQKDCVGGKVVPGEYELFVTDGSGNEVSDIRRVNANMTSADETSRVFKVQLSLKAGGRYNPTKLFYLVCRDKTTGASWQEEYQIDIPFVPMDDFGF